MANTCQKKDIAGHHMLMYRYCQPLQVTPTLRIEIKEYISLAEKALVSSGMAAAVWLLVQLHQAHAISFYQLPSLTATAVPELGVKGASGDPTSAASAGRTSPQALITASSDVSKARVHLEKDDAEGGGRLHDSPEEGPGGGRSCSTLMLIGVSVDVSIILVLSWAAQLVQLDVTSVMMHNDTITFELGM